MFNLVDTDGSVIESNLTALEARELATQFASEGKSYRVVPADGSEVGVIASTTFAKMAEYAIRHAHAINPSEKWTDNDGNPVNNKYHWSSLLKQALKGRTEFSEKQIAFITGKEALARSAVEGCKRYNTKYNQVEFKSIDDLDWTTN